MDIFDLLTLVGGLAMFLFGMNIMGQSLEKRAGRSLRALLEQVTANPMRGFLLGLGVTAIMQSSSVTTVMVVGFVNSGLMMLGQTIPVIMGANLGASVTNWILSLSGVNGENFFIQLCKPSSFTPVLALIGVVLHNFMKDPKKKDTGMILLGFSILMFGMETMSGAVSGVRQSPMFEHMIRLFSNPIMGVVVGVTITAIIQSSSASIGILQAISNSGGLTYNAVIPIIMGQNIGTCISALLSCIGASKNAQRSAVIHLMFNVFSLLICLPLYLILNKIFSFSFSESYVTPLSIAMVNTIYKIVSILLIAPWYKALEPVSRFIIRGGDSREEDDKVQLLDERLLATPAVAIERCKTVLLAMAELSVIGVQQSFKMIFSYDSKSAQEIMEAEDKVDYYEDKLGSYLIKLSYRSMSHEDSHEANKLQHLISDFERISDYSVNILNSAEEKRERGLEFSPAATEELKRLIDAVSHVLDLTLNALRDDDLKAASQVEPLEQVVDKLKELIRTNHIERLQSGVCTIEMGFILTDLLTNMERVSDHCSNIAGCLLEMVHEDLDLHEYLHNVRHSGGEYDRLYAGFLRQYLPEKVTDATEEQEQLMTEGYDA